MNGARIRGRHLWSSALAVVGPAWLVLAALAAGDLLGVWPAIAAAAAVAVPGLLLAARFTGRLAVVRDRLEALASGRGAAPEAGAGGLETEQVGDILKVVRRVERSWADERTYLGEEIGTAARLFDVLPDPLLAVDGDMRVVFANRATRALLDERSAGHALSHSIYRAGSRGPDHRGPPRGREMAGLA